MVVILQVPLVDKSPLMNVYMVYNLCILHPALQRTFHYSLEGEILAFSSNGDYDTIPLECHILKCVFTGGYKCQFDATLYPLEKVYGVFMSCL